MNEKRGEFDALNAKTIRRFHVTTAWRVPWVADGGVGLQIWRLVANILNAQSWTADQEWSSSLGGLA